MKSSVNKNGGFSLVEVLIALFLLSIIVASASAAFVFSTKTTLDNEIRMNALNIANETIEKIRALPFSEVGTKFRTVHGTYISGDPPGDILQEEIIQLNGVNYLVKVSINWEEEADWDLSGNAEWDYKSVRVSVTPQGYSSYHKLEQTIETYVTRDSSQPALSGSNIRIRCIRGWILPDENIKVVPGINALLLSGPSAVRFVQTSSKGIASFINLIPGNYTVQIDTTSQGYMIHPNKSSTVNINIEELATESFEVEIEKPCSLSFLLKDLGGNPILTDHLNPGSVGKISLIVPYPSGNLLEVLFISDDIDDSGMMPNLISNLWPVGDGYAGAYSLANVTLDNLQFFGGYTDNGTDEVLWNGKFNYPGETKEITLYFNVAPITPVGITTDWVDEPATIRIGLFVAEDEDGNPLEGVLSSNDLASTLIMPENNFSDFNALKIFVENKGTSSTPGLLIKKNSIIKLNGREIIFRGRIDVETASHPGHDGRLQLSTTWENGRETSDIYGRDIGDESTEPDRSYGKLYLEQPVYLGSNKIIDAGGYYFPSGIVLPDQSNRLIPFTKENYIE